MKRIALIAVLALVAACQSEETPDTLAPVGEARVTAEKQNCEAQGGTFGRGGRSQANICFKTPRDAGKTCEQNSDCEGLCLARSRSCAPIVPLFGCNEVLVGKGQTATICVD